MAKAQPRGALRDRMIAIGEDILAGQGLPALQARTVAKAAGVSVGTVYNVFGNIDELILIANSRTLAELGKVLAAASERTRTTSLQDRLLALAIGYLDFACAHNRRWKAIFEHVMAESRPVPAWYREGQRPLLATLASALPASMEPQRRALMAQTLFSAAHGIVMLALDRKLADVFDRELTEQQLHLLVEGAARSLGGSRELTQPSP